MEARAEFPVNAKRESSFSIAGLTNASIRSECDDALLTLHSLLIKCH